MNKLREKFASIREQRRNDFISERLERESSKLNKIIKQEPEESTSSDKTLKRKHIDLSEDVDSSDDDEKLSDDDTYPEDDEDSTENGEDFI